MALVAALATGSPVAAAEWRWREGLVCFYRADAERPMRVKRRTARQLADLSDFSRSARVPGEGALPCFDDCGDRSGPRTYHEVCFPLLASAGCLSGDEVDRLNAAGLDGFRAPDCKLKSLEESN
jgi:hypothetical protein